MADKIDKSLDEIIKDTRGNGRGGGRGRGGRGGRGGGGGNRRFRPNGGAGTLNNTFPRRQQPGGSIQKRRSGGGGPGALNTSLSPGKAVAASINGQWNHDLYQNGAAVLNSGAFRRTQAVALANASGGPAKLVISNLDFGVNDSDIEGLFQEFGKIRKAAVHYDRSGRSLGTADVLFERKQDAIRALTHYNGVSLDGRPMNIQLTASLSARLPSARVGGGGGFGGQRRGLGGRRNGPPRNGGGGGGAGAGAAAGGRGGRNNRGRQKREVKSAAELDADLDSHNAKMQTD